MKKAFLFAFVLGACVCAGGAELEKVVNKGPVHNPPAGSAAAEPVVVRLDGAGECPSVSVAKGRVLIVVIVGNPSTGYQWELNGRVDGVVLTQEGRAEFVAAESDMVGVPGEYRFTFRAAGAGATVVGFKYVRPWEQGRSPAKAASVSVTVTE